MNRREALAGMAGISATVVLPSAASTIDPIFAAIDRHRRAFDFMNPMEGEDEGFDEANRAEIRAWNELVRTEPATLDGLAAFASYVAVNQCACGGDEDAATALMTIAAAVAPLEGRAV